MIQLTRLNNEKFLLNSDLIEQVDITPDTLITLTNREQILVRESASELMSRIIQFRQAIQAPSSKPEIKPAEESVDLA
jgi:flagellar protein FlbD